MHGKIELFSIDKLVFMLAHIGKHIDVIVTDKAV
jgi:predicted XRE-type DNA-binding protein